MDKTLRIIKYARWAILPMILLVTALAYWPGLAGGFLFDDFANLPALGRYGGVRSWDSLLWYLSSGIADPTGRPVSMLSFLTDATNWPADPAPFKRTNLLVHLANGALLYGVLVALGHRISADRKHIRAAALLATAMWLMHPLWVSTVLYIIQRQAMLATLFVLAGIRLWVASRDAFENGAWRQGLVLALMAVPLCGLLAGFSKANGFLLPLLIGVLELTVLRWRTGQSTPELPITARRLRWMLVWLPAMLLLGWLLWRGISVGLDGTSGRPWTLAQRMLSQPRAILEYLHQLVAPGISATGVFADGFKASRGLFEPWTTFPALVLIAGLVVFAFVARARLPVLAASILFYFAGHAMEGSTVMLELYFEHRNYLPATLLFWPLAWWATKPAKYRSLAVFACCGYLVIMAAATHVQAGLWADPLRLAQTWAAQNPESARAQAYAASQEHTSGLSEAAEQRLQDSLRTNPEEPQLALNLLDIRCEQGRVGHYDVLAASQSILATRGLQLDMTYHWLARALLPNSDSACSALSAPDLKDLLTASIGAARNHQTTSAEFNAREQRLLGLFALRVGECDVVLRAFDKRIQIQPRPEFMQDQVVLLATQCGPQHALSHLDRYRRAGAPIARASSPMLRLRDRLMRRYWWQHWQELEQTLRGELALDNIKTPSKQQEQPQP